MKTLGFFLSFIVVLLCEAFGQQITLTVPNGGEDWPAGSLRYVTWTSSGIPAGTLVKLVLFKDGVKIGNIVQNVSIVAGAYNWKVGEYEGERR